MTEADRDVLLRLARASIVDTLLGSGVLDETLAEIDVSGRLSEPRATFVTLRQAESDGRWARLRGCIGTLEAVQPLYRSIIDNANRAAFHDPRFDPLTAEEISSTRIAVSVLTPLRPVERPEAIVPGRDGVELERDGRRAVFLPEVAEEMGWDTTTLLTQLALKAGLPPDAWKGARLAVFRSEKFAERPPAARVH